MGDVRDKSSGLLNATLTDLSTQQSDANAQASAVEQALFDKHQGDTGNAYRSDVRELSQNLKHNPDIGARVAEGEVPADELVNMTSEQLKSSKRAAEDSELRQQGLRDARGGEGKMPVYGEGQRTAQDMQAEGEVGNTDASMGEEGDFKLRGQPKVQGLEGVEFETGF